MLTELVILGIVIAVVWRYWPQIRDGVALFLMFFVGLFFVTSLYGYHKVSTLYMTWKRTKNAEEE